MIRNAKKILRIKARKFHHQIIQFVNSRSNSTQKMKLFVAILFAVCALAAASEFPEYDNIDWDKVVPVQDMPGFWDDKDAALIPDKSLASGRIVGGAIATPHQFPFQVALLVTFGGGQGLCGGSVIGAVSFYQKKKKKKSIPGFSGICGEFLAIFFREFDWIWKNL